MTQSNGRSKFEAENVIDPISGKPVEGSHELQTGCGNPVFKIPYMSVLFKRGNAGREVNSCLLMVTPRIIIQDED